MVYIAFAPLYFDVGGGCGGIGVGGVVGVEVGNIKVLG
jgi:hypothetical protein